MLLRDFFEQAFLPLELSGAAAGYAPAYRAAMHWLREYLGEEPDLRHLNARDLATLMLCMSERGVGPAQVRHTRDRLAALWRSAVRLGLLDHYEPVVFLHRSPSKSGRLAPANKCLDGRPALGSVWAYFEEVYRPRKMVGCAASSIEETRSTLRAMREFFGRDLGVDEQTDALAAEFFAWLEERGASRHTINRHRAHWFKLWRHALPDRKPEARKLAVDLDEPDAWSEAEARRLIEAAGRLRLPPIAGIPSGKFWVALLLIGWYTGQRRRALLSIQRSDVDLVERWVTVRGRGMKHRRGKRFRFGPDAAEALRAIWLPERELLFPWPYQANRTVHHFDAILKLAGIVKGSRRGLTQFHKLRRTVATETAIRRGLSAATELLGHSGPHVTRRYIDPSKLPGSDYTEFLPPLIDRRKKA